MTRLRSERLSAFDLVEAFQLSHAVSTLHNLRILASLAQASTVQTVSRKHKVDQVFLRGVLEYVAARTDLIRKVGERFVATRRYSGSSHFLLDLYTGAYRGNAVRLSKLLQNPKVAPEIVDRVRHARALRSGEGALGGLPDIIRQLGFNHLLDIGCGAAALLLDLATRDETFVGWGVDINPSVCRLARARIRDLRVARRVRVLEGDPRRLDGAVPATVRRRVEAVTASQVLNEFFGSGSSRAVTWLRRIRKEFPGRPLLIADYYGRLGTNVRRYDRVTLLHDYVQLLSGQGVPPSGVAEWRAIYASAGCQLLHVIEDRATTRFIHVVRL